MTHDAQTCASFDCMEEDTIASVYNGSAAKSSVSQWIHEHRYKKSMRDFYSSDESEGCFLAAITTGAQISRTHVCFCERPTWSIKYSGKPRNLVVNVRCSTSALRVPDFGTNIFSCILSTTT